MTVVLAGLARSRRFWAWLPVAALPPVLVLDAALSPDHGTVTVTGVVAAVVACLPLVIRDRLPFVVLAPILTGGIVLVLMAKWGTENMNGFAVNFVAAQSCINAVLDIRVLFAAKMYVDGQERQESDAHAVSRAWGGPHWTWAVLWLVWSFVMFYLALRYVRLRAEKSSLPVRSQTVISA